jgi:hypothetical protein
MHILKMLLIDQIQEEYLLHLVEYKSLLKMFNKLFNKVRTIKGLLVQMDMEKILLMTNKIGILILD